MILPKFESHHLDLPNTSYQFYKIAFKTAQMNYPFTKTVTDTWDPWISGPRRSTTENRGWRARRRGNGVARRRLHLRRGQWHRRVPSDDTHLPIPFPRPLPRSSYDGVGNGGRRRGRCGTPAMASPHCPTQARYKLHGVTTELER